MKKIKIVAISIILTILIAISTKAFTQNFKVVKIDSIETKYLIYVERNDSIFKIVTNKAASNKSNNQIQIGKRYSFHIKSYFDDMKIDGIDLSPRGIQNVTHFNIDGVGIELEWNCKRNLYYSTDIAGKYFIDNKSCLYLNCFNKLDSMLMETMPLNFKKAVYLTENVFLDNQLNYEKFNDEIKSLVNVINSMINNEVLHYSGEDKRCIEKHAILFKVIKDTVPVFLDSTHILIHTPFLYDFEDIWGQKDWTKMFVSKLLSTGKGNCHSLPYLYKILSEELNIPAYLAFAPNHIYIKTFSKKMGWYNTELTSGTFPVDAWLMASGYISVEAVQNGLYMDTLSTKQSVANCLLDLAQGYQHKFGKENPDFVVKCCNTCLKYHPTNVNAMLTKAEAQKFYIQAQMKARNVKTPEGLFTDKSIKEMYADMEQTYVKLHQLGYRRMPEEMYTKWIASLKNEPNKYNNPKVSGNPKKK